jgi:diaminohydroxyphosphoribosylaminopyrimidine deaminase/5-amino-6-(5-phosphoribosylamino)uracil reductase
LREAGARATSATLYVTLEPCTHHGKQPPCVDAIIAAGIAQVVAATADPNPEAQGGLARLRAAGIAVDLGVLRHGAEHDNFRFVHRFSGAERPFVAVKLAVSMDGMIADQSGDSRWLSDEVARDWVHWLRAGFGAVAVGGATAVHDDVRLTVRGPVSPRVPPARVVFDRSGKLSPTAAIFVAGDAPPPIVVVDSSHANVARQRWDGVAADVVVADVLDGALRQLHDRGIDSMLVEGGGRLAGALLDAGLVDRIYQIQCPLWLGAGRPAWADMRPRTMAASPRWHVVHTELLGADVLIELAPR